MSSEQEATVFFSHPRGDSYSTTVTADAHEIRWINRRGSGSLAYSEITAIELLVGEADPVCVPIIA